MLRQMEYDADRYEVKMAGSKAFETTTRRLALLREAAAKANMEARAMWRIGRHLPDNFPEFVLQYEAKVPIALRDIIDARATRSKTGLFDSYPADGERIRRARAANEAGTFRAEPAGPALFSDFELLAKHATFSYYVEKLGLNLESSNLGPVAAG